MKKLVVFDLDFTLWDAGGTWCDHTHPPYKRKNDFVLDSHGSKIMLYPDVVEILEYLERENILMGIASRTGEPTWARNLMELFEIENYFSYSEIYPSSKVKHFTRIQQQANIPFSEMLFFDDEMRNITEVGSLGVTAIFVPNGIKMDMLERYLGL